MGEVTPLTSPHGTGFLCQGCLNCFTPFTHFLCLVSVYQPFHLHFIHDTCVFSSFLAADFCLIGLSPVFVCITALLFFIYHLSLSLCAVIFRPNLFGVCCVPCQRRMGSWGLRSPTGYGLWNPTCFFFFWPGLLQVGWLGWPTQSISWSCFALILIRRQWQSIRG